ncbi:protein-serine,threonine phosphatase [Sarracenia purpurea var. burkii]
MMNCRVLATTFPSSWAPPKFQTFCSRPSTIRIQCSSSSSDLPITLEKAENNVYMTGGAYDFEKATLSLTQKLMASPKKVTLVRHGLSSWNEENRVQGSSDLSILTESGVRQAERCRKALENVFFDQCFSSPISRAKSTAEILWHGKEEPLVFLDSLKEAHLFSLEGMRNVFGGSGC